MFTTIDRLNLDNVYRRCISGQDVCGAIDGPPSQATDWGRVSHFTAHSEYQVLHNINMGKAEVSHNLHLTGPLWFLPIIVQGLVIGQLFPSKQASKVMPRDFLRCPALKMLRKHYQNHCVKRVQLFNTTDQIGESSSSRGHTSINLSA